MCLPPCHVILCILKPEVWLVVRMSEGEGVSRSVGRSMEPRRVYEHLRQIAGKPVQRRGRRKVNDTPTDNMPFAPGRDPRVLSESLSALATTLGWTGPLAQHCTPVGIEGGLLQVQCASTTWATQLPLMRTDLLSIIITRFPDAEMSS